MDIRVQLPDGSVIRERKKASASSKQAAQKWAESRERVLLVHGKPKPAKEDVQKILTLKEFALRFLDGYAKANRLNAKAFGDKRLDEISTEDVQRLKAARTEDREQRAYGVECGAEDGSGVGHHRANTMLDQAAQSAQG